MRYNPILTFVIALSLVACATSPTPQPSPGATAPAASQTPESTPAPSPKAAASTKPAFVQQVRSLLSELQTTYPDGYVSSLNRYEYDSQGRLVMDTETNGSKSVVNSRRYLYSPDGTVQIDFLDGEGRVKSKTIQTWQDGLLVKERVLNDKDEEQSNSDYQYNATGQKTSWIIQGKGTATTASEYTWTDGLLTKILVMDMARTPIKSYLRAYDKSGNLASEIEADGKGAPIRKTEYNWADGRLAGETINSPVDAKLKSSVNHYDAQGRLIRTEILNRRGELQEIQLRTWIEISVAVPNK